MSLPPAARHLLNAAPAVAFLVVLLASRGDFQVATWVLMGLSIAALAVTMIVDRKIAPIPALSVALALLFGGFALVFHRVDILQLKMTIMDGALGTALMLGLAMKRNLLKMLLGQAVQLPDDAWRTLTIRYALFWWGSAIANEIVRNTQTVQVWAVFKIAALVAAVLFGAAQVPLLRKYWRAETPTPSPEPPEPGF